MASYLLLSWIIYTNKIIFTHSTELLILLVNPFISGVYSTWLMCEPSLKCGWSGRCVSACPICRLIVPEHSMRYMQAYTYASQFPMLWLRMLSTRVELMRLCSASALDKPNQCVSILAISVTRLGFGRNDDEMQTNIWHSHDDWINSVWKYGWSATSPRWKITTCNANQSGRRDAVIE